MPFYRVPSKLEESLPYPDSQKDAAADQENSREAVEMGLQAGGQYLLSPCYDEDHQQRKGAGAKPEADGEFCRSPSTAAFESLADKRGTYGSPVQIGIRTCEMREDPFQKRGELLIVDRWGLEF